MAVLFDTLKMANRLEAAGFSQKQAKALVEAFAEVVGEESSRLAPKTDLEAAQLNMTAAITESKAELVRWVVGVGVLQMVLIAGLYWRIPIK